MAVLESSGRPLETRPLADVHVGDFHLPFRDGKLASEKSSDGAFAYPALLRKNSDDDSHDCIG